MEFKHVAGKNKAKLVLFSLSTCIWCKKTKKLLSDLGLDYSYLDVDLLDAEDETRAVNEIKKWNPRCSFPTLVINEERCIMGYDETQIRAIAQ